jgi:hypothetical protein
MKDGASSSNSGESDTFMQKMITWVEAVLISGHASIGQEQRQTRIMTTTIRLDKWWRCDRWFRVIDMVLIVRPSRDMIIYLLSRDAEDACGIAKHLKMGVKEKDGEILLEAAADWAIEHLKIWLEKDLHKVLNAIGLEDLEAWKKKYNIIANNVRLKLDMLMIINYINKLDIQKYWIGKLTHPEEVDKFIIKFINDQSS